MMKRLHVLTIAACSLLCAPSSQALVIDDFTTAQTANGSPSFVSGPGILGIERAISISTGTDKSFVAGGGTATFSGGPNSDLGAAFMSWDGPDGSTAIDFGLAPADLTDGGASDRFLLDVLSVSGSLTFSIVTGQSWDQRSFGPQTTITSPGLYEIPFSAFAGAADFSGINAVWLSFLTSDPGANESITFGAFTTVPEPSSALLIGIGLCLMRGRRRSIPDRGTWLGARPRCPLRQLQDSALRHPSPGRVL